MLSKRRKSLRKIIEEDGITQEHDAIQINRKLGLKKKKMVNLLSSIGNDK